MDHFDGITDSQAGAERRQRSGNGVTQSHEATERVKKHYTSWLEPLALLFIYIRKLSLRVASWAALEQINKNCSHGQTRNNTE
jgi:hypothetical protein